MYHFSVQLLPSINILTWSSKVLNPPQLLHFVMQYTLTKLSTASFFFHKEVEFLLFRLKLRCTFNTLMRSSNASILLPLAVIGTMSSQLSSTRLHVSADCHVLSRPFGKRLKTLYGSKGRSF